MDKHLAVLEDGGLIEYSDKDDLGLEDTDPEVNELNELAQDNNWDALLSYFDPADQDSLSVLIRSFRVKDRRLARQEEIEIIDRAQKGNAEARQILVESFFGLVLRQVLRYRRHHNIRSEHPTMSVADLVQEGWIGFFKAVGKWKASKGCRLSTYAVPWIDQAIRQTMDVHGRMIQLPVYQKGRLSQFLKDRSALEIQLGRTPTDQELAEKLSISEAMLAERYLQMEEVGSLQSPLCEDDATELGGILPDQSTSLVRQAWLSELRERVAEAVQSLTIREQEVLNLRYGLINGRERTLKEVGWEVRLTRVRVHQIEQKALKDLGRRYPDLFDGHTVF